MTTNSLKTYQCYQRNSNQEHTEPPSVERAEKKTELRIFEAETILGFYKDVEEVNLSYVDEGNINSLTTSGSYLFEPW